MTKYRQAFKTPRKNGVVYPHDKTAKQCSQCQKIAPTDEAFYFNNQKQKYFAHCKKCHIEAQYYNLNYWSDKDSCAIQHRLNTVGVDL